MKNEKIKYLILWLLLVFVVFFLSSSNKSKETSSPLILPLPSVTADVSATKAPEITNLNEDVKGAWISYIALSETQFTEDSFKQKFSEYITTAKANEITDLFVHTRPFCDALYKSDIFPWSHLLSGTQGQDPLYDPLEFMIDLCHENGIRFHAWINPLRVKLKETPNELSSSSPYSEFVGEQSYYFFEKDEAIYINPAYKEMRTLISDGVVEIVKNYDVDGIHFDDYFYPANMGDLDSSSYNLYTQTTANPLSVEKWRETNINTLIAQVYREIKIVNEDVVFGISPQGNNNNNKALGANVETWCNTKGYIDYICPQIYFSYDNPSLSFEKCLNNWLSIPRLESVKLYIGLAQYKVGTDADSGTWLNKGDIIEKQKKESLEKTDGYILYEIRQMTK